MAIYHLHLQNISKGSGRSSVAASAYRSGEKLTNEQDGIIHDYTKKNDVIYTNILSPDHAPGWTQNREKLWNQVEQIEKSSNARLAKEINIALPIELNKEQQINLVKEYAQVNFVARGMVADIAIHDKQDGNPHAHIMLTNRPFNELGQWSEKSKKEYILNEQGEKIKLPSGEYKSRKINLNNWNDRTSLEQWRKGWEQSVNKSLELVQSKERIDHRSYKAQGLDRKPTKHLGVAAHQMEQRGIETDNGNLNRAIVADNRRLQQLNYIEQERSIKYIQIKEDITAGIIPIENKRENKKAVIHTEELLIEKEPKKPTLLELRQRDEQLTKKLNELLKDKYTTLEPYFKKVAERYIENKYKEPEKALAEKKANYITKVEEYNSKGAVFRFASNLTKNTKVTLDKEMAQIQSMERQLKQSKEKEKEKETITLTGDDKESKAIRSYCLKKTKENPKIKQIDRSLELVKADRLEVSKQIKAIQDERVLQRKPKEKTLDRSMYFGR